jgi:hypothetical protein
MKNKLVFNCTPEVAEYLEQLNQSGELQKILGISSLKLTIEDRFKTVSNQVRIWDCLQETANNLDNYLMGVFTEGWNHLKNVWESAILEDNQLAYRSRSDIKLTDEEMDFQKANKLFKENPNNQEAINLLLDLIKNTEYENLRWKAIELLAKYNSENLPKVIGICKEFGLRLADNNLKLSVAFIQINKTEVSILLRLYANNNQVLPKGISLQVFEESGELLDQFPYQDDVIDENNLEEIRGIVIFERGESFTVKVVAGDDSITEFFTV